MSKPGTFWAELRRRHVVRAAVAHTVFFWLLAQVAETVLPYVGVVDEPVRWAVVAGIALFPVTLVVAWFFEHPWHRFTGSRIALDLAVLSVIAVVALTWAVRNIPDAFHARTSIVVLPFEHEQTDSLGEALSRAVSVEVNSLLMKSRSIDVVGYESANSSLLAGLDVAAIMELLDVQHVLSGIIRSAGASMQVEARLHDRTGRQLWSLDIDEDLDRLYDVQERIAGRVQDSLGEEGDVVPVAQIAAARCPMPTEPDALERFFTARHYVESRTESEQSRREQNEAVALYEGLMAQYPEFAQARSGLAWALWHLVVYDSENHSRQVNEPRAIAHAQEAVDICPQLGEALVMLPNEADHPNPWINTEQQMSLWLRLQPGSVEAQQKMIRHLHEVGRNREALELAQKNYALNPLSVRSIKNLSSVLQYMQRFDEAIALNQRAGELGSTAPNHALGAKKMRDCGDDLDCRLDQIPPPFQPIRDQLFEIYTPPGSEEERQAKVALALEVLREKPDWRTNWFNYSACEFDHLTPLFFDVWEVANETGSYWYWPNMWQSNCGNVWDEPAFWAFVESVGLVEYWRAKGWPEACRPEGEGLVCGQAVFDESWTASG